MKTKLFPSAGAVVLTLALSLLTRPAALAASPSDLLEQGIFSEETKGDLDAALKLYQQAVAETKAGQAVGAQAQYRLGVILYKKKNYADASAAFEKLIHDYPDEKDLIARARTYLSGAVFLLPAPWADGEELRLDLKFSGGKKLGFARYSARSSQLDGRKTWVLRSRIFAGVEQFSRVEVEADSFKPIHCRWKHTMIGEADTTYTAGGADLKLAGKDGVQHFDLKDVIFDNEEAIELIRRLPLGTNYTTTVRVFTGLGGGNTIPVKTSVVGIEKVDVPAGTFDCYRVELVLGVKQTFWYSTDDHHYLVKFEANGVAAELTEIAQPKPGAPVVWQASGFSLSAPPDWIFYQPEILASSGVPEVANKRRLLLLDPEATAPAEISLRKLDSLKPETRKSVRDWAEQLIIDCSEEGKLTVRADSWQERKIAGQPAVSFIAERGSGKEQKLVYAICTFVRDQAVYFSVEISNDSFDAYRPGFDAVAESLRVD
jgi:exonuclease VII small subunit